MLSILEIGMFVGLMVGGCHGRGCCLSLKAFNIATIRNVRIHRQIVIKSNIVQCTSKISVSFPLCLSLFFCLILAIFDVGIA